MEREPIRFTIPVAPRTKKNSQEIRINRHTGKYYISPSKIYERYAREAAIFIRDYGINEPVNVKAVYYRKTKHRVDLTNLHEALHDVLVHCGALEDDNCKIVVSTDGSRVDYDKDNPRTEVEITFLEDHIDPFQKK